MNQPIGCFVSAKCMDGNLYVGILLDVQDGFGKMLVLDNGEKSPIAASRFRPTVIRLASSWTEVHGLNALVDDVLAAHGISLDRSGYRWCAVSPEPVVLSAAA